MQIQLESGSMAITLRDRLQLRQRAAHWLRKLDELIAGLSVRISSAPLAGDARFCEARYCEIRAHLDNGMRLSAAARGGDAIVAIDRALRRLARAITSKLKRADNVRQLRAMLQS